MGNEGICFIHIFEQRIQSHLLFLKILSPITCYEPRTRDITGGQTLERLVRSSVNPL